MSLYVVIPAHNEEKNIQLVIRNVRNYCDNIIVIDDGSKDKTASIAKEAGALVLKNIINLGKGSALRVGCDYACMNGAKKLVVIDADGQHDPNKIPLFFDSLNKSEVVFGYRVKFNSMPIILKFGNNFINKVSSFLNGINLNDTQCGYRAFTFDAYKKIRWSSSDYSMESEMISNVGKNNLVYSQIPIQTIYSDKYKGTTILDGFKIVIKMFWWRLN